jgi:glycosyltransferase involved in cell wall biosynthesis
MHSIFVYPVLCTILFTSCMHARKMRAARPRPAKTIPMPVVNVVGYVHFTNGLGRVTTTVLDILAPSLRVKHIDTRPAFSNFTDVPLRVQAITKKRYRPVSHKVSILTDNLWLPHFTPANIVPKSTIRLAYSMCESTKAPQPWVQLLNRSFDAVVVPDVFLVDVYQNSGVKIPIFVLPLAVYLNDFLQLPLKQARSAKTFTFGIVAALSHNKNVQLVVDAFAAEFGNNPSVQLKIHTPWRGTLGALRAHLKKLNVNNIHLSVGSLPWRDYVQFMNHIDCYVLLSRGEGFSITVREAMALGLPCIISDNTAHHTICQTGLVYPVPAPLRQPSKREFYQVDVGDNFGCRLKDARQALRYVYDHYPEQLQRAAERRAWVTQYTKQRLAPLYNNLVRPKQIILGDKNSITPYYLMTNSQKLYQKYQSLKNSKS